MPKKRKLNSKNPKYWSKDAVVEPKIKEKKLIAKKGKIKVYAIFEEDIQIIKKIGYLGNQSTI